MTKNIPKKKKHKKAKGLSVEALQIAEKRREVKDKGEREKIYPIEYSSREKQGEIKNPS